MTTFLTKVGKIAAYGLFTSALILALLENYGIDVTGIVSAIGLPADMLATVGIGGLATMGLALYTKSSTLTMANTAKTVSTETITYLAKDKEKREEQIKEEKKTQTTLNNLLKETKLNNVMLAQTIRYNDIMARKNLQSEILTEQDKALLKDYRKETAQALKSLHFSLGDLVSKVGEEHDNL